MCHVLGWELKSNKAILYIPYSIIEKTREEEAFFSADSPRPHPQGY